MGATLYLLCTATAMFCCFLLLRSYRETQTRLLLWSALCFGMLALENLVLFLDLVVFTRADLSMVRCVIGLIGVIFLLYGLICHES